jgi:hypothetical protein
VNSTLNHLPDTRRKIVFDKFHSAKHLSEAVDQVRRRENKQLPVFEKLGNPMPVKAHGGESAYDPPAVREHRHLSPASHHQRCQRISQFKDKFPNAPKAKGPATHPRPGPFPLLPG